MGKGEVGGRTGSEREEGRREVGGRRGGGKERGGGGSVEAKGKVEKEVRGERSGRMEEWRDVTLTLYHSFQQLARHNQFLHTEHMSASDGL